MTLEITVIPVTPFQQNCSILCCSETAKAAVIDPGGEIDRILAAVDETRCELEKILLTHAHIDHAGGVAELARRLQISVEGPHVGDKFWIDMLAEQGNLYGIPGAQSFAPERWLNDGDIVSFGNIKLDVHHCPGHTPGHIIFYHAATHLAIVGDVLFQGSIGRTDFPGGDHATLIRSIRERLWPLGDDVRFIPGHGPVSTFGEERKTNPFVADHVL